MIATFRYLHCKCQISVVNKSELAHSNDNEAAETIYGKNRRVKVSLTI